MSAEAVPVRAQRQHPAHRLGAIAIISRVLSVAGAVLALGAIAFAAYRLHDYDQKIARKQAELSHFETQVTARQHELEIAQSKVNQVNAELAFAQAAYQRLSKDLPAGAAQRAIQETAATDRQAASVPPVVYIHIASQNQREKATQVQNTLRDKGYVVPGIEYVGAKSPNHTQLRYFVRTDEGPALDRTIALLRSAGLDVEGQYIAMASQSPRALRPHQFELWFGQDYQPQ